MNLTQVRRLVMAVGTVGLLNACAISFNANTLGVKASMSEPAGQALQGTEFEVSKKAVFLFFGILPVSNPSLENVLAGQLVDGSEVRNLRVKVRSRFADILITALTVGLVVPKSVTYNGVVVSDNGN